jgi:hypothetical protein
MAWTESLQPGDGTQLQDEVEDFLELVDRVRRNPWVDADSVGANQARFLADLGRRPASASAEAGHERANPWRITLEQVGGLPAT